MKFNAWTILNGTKNAQFEILKWLQLCKKELKPSSNFLRHVAKDHLNISLYQCAVCKDHGGQDAYEIRSHMQKLHGGCMQEPISNIEKYADEIQKMYLQCFPGRRLRVNF